MLENGKDFNNAKRANFNHNCMSHTGIYDTINIDLKHFRNVHLIFGAGKVENRTNPEAKIKYIFWVYADTTE